MTNYTTLGGRVTCTQCKATFQDPTPRGTPPTCPSRFHHTPIHTILNGRLGIFYIKVVAAVIEYGGHLLPASSWVS